MKVTLLYALAALLLLAGCSKKKDFEPGRMIRTISGSYTDTGDDKTISYAFEYDNSGRVTSLTYVGDLYLYGEGFIHATYTYAIDYSGGDMSISLKTENPCITALTTNKKKVPYEDLGKETESVPVTRDAEGNLVGIDKDENGFYLTDVLTYQSGYLRTFGEEDGDYWKAALDFEWSNGSLTAQTYREAGYTERREFGYTEYANDYSIDLNWLAADLGLHFQNGLTPLALIGLTGGRSPQLIGTVTESGGSESAVTYTVRDGTVVEIRLEAEGATHIFRLGY